LSHAGGASNLYSKWPQYIESEIKIVTLEMSGRGRRFTEALIDNIDDMIEDLMPFAEKELDGSPYAFFGHSMGSLVSYELSHKIWKETGQAPIHMFFSGRYPPHLIFRDKIFHTMSDEEFINELKKIGGTPEEVYQNNSLMDIFLRVLRADYKLLETYLYRQYHQYDCDISLFYGNNDETTAGNMGEWVKYTNGDTAKHVFIGGHFFLTEHVKELVSIINQILTSYEPSDIYWKSYAHSLTE